MTPLRPFRDRPAGVWLGRDVVTVAGPDAVAFLQGQLSQDIEGLERGRAAWSFLLEPQGKIDALLRVARSGDDEVLMWVEEGYGGAVVERIERFKLRVKAEVALVPWRVLAVRGPADAVGLPPAAELGGAHVAAVDDPGLAGYDAVGPDPRVPDGVEVVHVDWFDAVRIEAGLPSLGRDLEVGAIPAESGLVGAAASFTKGCYTGQELVARIDSRGGRAPHQLVGVLLDDADGVPLRPGSSLSIDGSDIGSVTSVAGPPVREQVIGLARVKRSVELPARAMAAGDDGDGESVARLVALPLVS